MRSAICLTVVFVLSIASSLSAQDWAREMLRDENKTIVDRHDFGTVAFNTKTEFRFPIKNIYLQDMHISKVSTSCQCTTPTIVKKGESVAQHDGVVLKTDETCEILATFNTHKMTGHRQATLTVYIGGAFNGILELHVSGNIVTDIVVNPTYVDLGTVAQGGTQERTISVTRSGRRDWTISDVRSVNTNFEVSLGEPVRTLSSATYNLKVRLKNTAPAGSFDDKLILVTNDNYVKQFPIQVVGEVRPEITVTPNLWTAGTLNPGDKASKNLVLRNNKDKPFKILEITTDENNISFPSFDANAPAKKMHVVPLTLTASSNPGRQFQRLNIVTDLDSDQGKKVTLQLEVKYITAGTVNDKKSEQNVTKDQKTGKIDTNVAKPLAVSPGSVLNTNKSITVNGTANPALVTGITPGANNVSVPGAVGNVQQTNTVQPVFKPEVKIVPDDQQNNQRTPRAEQEKDRSSRRPLLFRAR